MPSMARDRVRVNMKNKMHHTICIRALHMLPNGILQKLSTRLRLIELYDITMITILLPNDEQ